MDYNAIEKQQQANINQGQQDYQSDINNAYQYQQQYNQNTATAQGAQQKVSDYANYLQGAGSGANVYGQQLQAAQKNASYDPARMAAAQQDALRQSAAMNALQQQQNTPGGYYSGGLSAAQNAALMQSQLAPVQQGVQNANTVLGQQNTSLQNALSQADTGTGAQLKTQEQVQSQLKDSFDAANTQAINAKDQMQSFYALAQSQQGLNASQQQAFFKARNDYQTAINQAAQASLAAQQTIGQQQRNTMLGNVLNSSSYKDYVAHPEKYNVTYGQDGTPQITLKTPTTPTTPTNTTSTNKLPSQSFTKNATGWTREGLNFLNNKGFRF